MSISISKAKLLKILSRKNLPLIACVEQADLLPAAVLVPIIEEPKELKVLFTERNQNLLHHAGQISFPGGRMEAIDQQLEDTALRETFEEIGLTKDKINIISQLPNVISTSGYLVTPFVAIITPPLNLKLDPAEVAGTFLAPLNYILDPMNQKSKSILYAGKRREIYIIDYQKYQIWGMTAKILVELRTILMRQEMI